MQSINLNRILQKLLGAEAKFRELQQKILLDILQRRSYIMAITPTASGKSLLYQLPSYIGNIGVTIVILPLIALLSDQIERAKQLGISAAIFDPRNPPDSVRLVFTTPERFRSDEFQNFLLRLRDLQQLDRIFIDECHVILNKNQSFRKDIGKLSEILDQKTQLILLTATLPPRYQSDLLGKFFLTPSDVQIYRLPSNRPNIVYSVRKNLRQREIFDLIRTKSNEYSNDRLIVYTKTRNQAQEYAKELNWPTYYSNSKGKQRILSNFLTTKFSNQRIIATNSLGLGLNPPNIRAVIHVGRPYTMYDYAQESGRAGRNQQKSEAILIIPFSALPSINQIISKNERQETAIIDQYIDKECRRSVLSGYLDGSIIPCGENDQSCDICLLISSGIFFS